MKGMSNMSDNHYFQSPINLVELIIVVSCAVVAILTTVLYGSPSETVLGIFGGALGLGYRQNGSGRPTTSTTTTTNNYANTPPVESNTKPSDIVTSVATNAVGNIAHQKIDEANNKLNEMVHEKCDEVLDLLKKKNVKSVKVDEKKIVTKDGEEAPLKSIFDK